MGRLQAASLRGVVRSRRCQRSLRVQECVRPRLTVNAPDTCLVRPKGGSGHACPGPRPAWPARQGLRREPAASHAVSVCSLQGLVHRRSELESTAQRAGPCFWRGEVSGLGGSE